MDDLFPLAITFPRFVKLENTRLTLTYWFLVISTVSFVVVTFIISEGYQFEKTPDGTAQFWPTNWNPPEETVKTLNILDEGKDHCEAPEKYEYCDSPSCSWSAKELQCIDICTTNSTQDCVEPAERFIKTDSGLFFPTFFSETTTLRTNGVRQEPETKWHILKGVEDMGIGFTHEYHINPPGSWISKGKREHGSSSSLESAYEAGLLTVLEDVDGNEVVRWEPGQALTLTVKQILKAGKISLDSVYWHERTNIGRNFLEGAHIPDGILMRLAGAEITLDLSYHNPANSRTSDWSGPVCYLRIFASPVWTSNINLQVVDKFDSRKLRYYQGLRIRFSSAGKFTYVSFEQVTNKFAQLLVFTSFAKSIMFYFSIFCLGVVSKVYKGFVFQRASLSKEACGLAARLTSHTSTFVALKDTLHGISEERLLRRFRIIFKHNPELDEGEIQRFVNFVYQRMAKDQSSGIDVQDYAHASSHGEAMHFKTLTELFDADRKKGILERTFAGPTMRQLFASDAKAHKLKLRSQQTLKRWEEDEEIEFRSPQGDAPDPKDGSYNGSQAATPQRWPGKEPIPHSPDSVKAPYSSQSNGMMIEPIRPDGDVLRLDEDEKKDAAHPFHQLAGLTAFQNPQRLTALTYHPHDVVDETGTPLGRPNRIDVVEEGDLEDGICDAALTACACWPGPVGSVLQLPLPQQKGLGVTRTPI